MGAGVVEGKKVRALSEVAAEISVDWRNVYFGARPYLDAMLQMTEVGEKYGLDDGREIVVRFLVNAGTWKGEVARRVKKELHRMVGM